MTLSSFISTFQIRMAKQQMKPWVMVCPKALRSMLVCEAHRRHHANGNCTFRRVQLNWYWSGMTADIQWLLCIRQSCELAKHGVTANSGHRQCLSMGDPCRCYLSTW